MMQQGEVRVRLVEVMVGVCVVGGCVLMVVVVVVVQQHAPW